MFWIVYIYVYNICNKVKGNVKIFKWDFYVKFIIV